jgi:hypothetical protein
MICLTDCYKNQNHTGANLMLHADDDLQGMAASAAPDVQKELSD